MSPHSSFIRALLTRWRALCPPSFGLTGRSGADPQTARREPPRESIFRSIAAGGARRSRFASGAFGDLRLEGCDH